MNGCHDVGTCVVGTCVSAQTCSSGTFRNKLGRRANQSVLMPPGRTLRYIHIRFAYKIHDNLCQVSKIKYNPASQNPDTELVAHVCVMNAAKGLWHALHKCLECERKGWILHSFAVCATFNASGVLKSSRSAVSTL